MTKTKAFQAKSASKTKFNRNGTRPDIAAGMKRHWEKKRQEKIRGMGELILADIDELRDRVLEFIQTL